MREAIATTTGRPNVHPLVERIRRRAAAERIPIFGTFELTSRCNLRCIHCYLGSGTSREESVRELSTTQVIGLLDEAVAAGCVQVLLTGGDPLLRADFPVIYRHARQSGTFVTVFTNGTLVRTSHVALFQELPPASVEVSLYGATPRVYEAVTGVPGSYANCLEGVRRLLDGGVKVELKTVILRTNQEEVLAMEALAQDLGVPFRSDPVLTPTLDGGRSPLSERVEPEVAARLEYTSEIKRQRSREYLAKIGRTPASERVYRCGAAVTSFYMTASGHLRPCLMTADMEFDTLSMGFEAAWREATRAIGKPTWDPASQCRSCEDLAVCSFCPALLRLETGRESTPSQYLCRLGEARRAILDTPDAMGINSTEEARV